MFCFVFYFILFCFVLFFITCLKIVIFRCSCLGYALVGVLLFGIGILIGYFIPHQTDCTDNGEEDKTISDLLLESISASNIEDNLR